MMPTTEQECRQSCQFNYCRDHGCYFKACGFMEPSNQAAFDAGLAEMDKKLKPLTDAIEASTRLTAEDFNTTINTRD